MESRIVMGSFIGGEGVACPSEPGRPRGGRSGWDGCAAQWIFCASSRVVSEWEGTRLIRVFVMFVVCIAHVVKAGSGEGRVVKGRGTSGSPGNRMRLGGTLDSTNGPFSLHFPLPSHSFGWVVYKARPHRPVPPLLSSFNRVPPLSSASPASPIARTSLSSPPRRAWTRRRQEPSLCSHHPTLSGSSKFPSHITFPSTSRLPFTLWTPSSYPPSNFSTRYASHSPSIPSQTDPLSPANHASPTHDASPNPNLSLPNASHASLQLPGLLPPHLPRGLSMAHLRLLRPPRPRRLRCPPPPTLM